MFCRKADTGYTPVCNIALPTGGAKEQGEHQDFPSYTAIKTTAKMLSVLLDVL